MKDELVPQVAKAIEILKKGGVIAFPTDTVYGLGAMANETDAIKRIFEIKERPMGLALPLLLASESEVDCAVVSVPPAARKLMYAFWPGAMALVFQKASWLPDIITAGSPNIALRVPNHEVPVALIKGVGMPIIGTSANVHGRPSAISAEEVKAQLNGKVDFIIEDGQARWAYSQPLLTSLSPPPKIVRQGAISREKIAEVVPWPEIVINLIFQPPIFLMKKSR